MNAILPDDGPVSMPSMPTQYGGDPDALGRIDQYDLLRKLGGGGFGVVYLARDSVSGIEVALKTLHPLLKHNAEEMDLLREKFRLVHGLTHPNIAKALVLHPCREIHVWDEAARTELKLSPGDSVMAMDYAPGVTLLKWRRQFPDGIVPFDLALEVGRQIASALDYAHAERIVHRDIKPGNIMVETAMPPPAASQVAGLTSQGTPETCDLRRATRIRVRILDFGLAAEIRSSMSRVSTEAGDTSGTRPYMAPEQWMGKKQDGRTDQYALACVLYELISGAPPFAGVFETGDPMIMKSAVVGDVPDEIEDVAPAVNAALLRALAKAPKDRFPTCAALMEALSSTTEDTEGRDGSTSRPSFGRTMGATLPGKGGAGMASSPREPTSRATLEADVLRRKVALSRALAAIPESVQKDPEFSAFVSDAELEADAVKEALDRNLMVAAASCLDRADSALAKLEKARKRREEAKRKAREAADRKAREVAERKEREELERRAQEEAERKAYEVAERKAREEAERRAQEEAERKERERREAEEAARQGAMRQDAEVRNSRREMTAAGVSFALLRIPATESRPAFWMGEVPVTQSLWRAVMREDGNPTFFKRLFGVNPDPSYFKGDDLRPVENVSWNDCQEFLRRFNALPELASSGLTYRLPMEEEWEQACRAGAEGDFCRMADGTEITAETLGRVAWYDDNSNNETHPVGQKDPNAWGLYDMHGNVWEWTATADGGLRVLRGGCFSNVSLDCRSVDRGRFGPDDRSLGGGFRLSAF